MGLSADSGGFELPAAAGSGGLQSAERQSAAWADPFATQACALCGHGCVARGGPPPLPGGAAPAQPGGQQPGGQQPGGQQPGGQQPMRPAPRRLPPPAWLQRPPGQRLATPLVRRDGQLAPASWEEAFNRIVAHTHHLLASQGPEAIGFYAAGQLSLEECYTLALLARAGLATPHLDAAVRLCSTAAPGALSESFGSAGQPGCYADCDCAATLLLVGRDFAGRQAPLWLRLLDRRHGPRPPQLVVIDPAPGLASRQAHLHLAPVPGSELALLNGLQRLLISSGRIDEAFIAAATVGFGQLARTLEPYTPQRVSQLSGVAVRDILAAAEIIGTAPSLLSIVLHDTQGPGSPAACQVNNLNLLRGLIGREGCGILQLGCAPGVDDIHQTGLDGGLPGLRNPHNPGHLDQLSRLWNVEPERIACRWPPGCPDQLFGRAAAGTIRLLWIAASGSAAWAPHLPLLAGLQGREELFVVVQDTTLSATAALADVVLPSAHWSEKDGTYTLPDRSVRRLQSTARPPAEARSDLQIFVEYSRRMGFKDRHGQPLIPWTQPAEAFRAWQACSAGRPCDYSGFNDGLLAGSMTQWPCNSRYPAGLSRLYAEHRFPTAAADCQSFGRDLLTGAPATAESYRANDPAGRARLLAAEYVPPQEAPDAHYPLWLITSRLMPQPGAEGSAAEGIVVVPAADAARSRLAQGDRAVIESRRGRVAALVRIGETAPGRLLLSLDGERDGLTLSQWDPLCLQALFGYAAVRIRKARPAEQVALAPPPTQPDMRPRPDGAALVSEQLGQLVGLRQLLARAFAGLGQRHSYLAEIEATGRLLSALLQWESPALTELLRRFGRPRPAPLGWPPHPAAAATPRDPLLAELVQLHGLAGDALLQASLLLTTAVALADRQLQGVCEEQLSLLRRQLRWLECRIDEVAADALSGSAPRPPVA